MTIMEKPILHAFPQHIDFGLLIQSPGDNEEINSDLKSNIIRITNNGGGILTGLIIPQVNWLDIFPKEINCSSGESAQHELILRKGVPQPELWKEYFLHDLIIINSNGGIQSVSGSYVSQGKRPANTRISLDWRFISISLLAAGIIIGMIILGIYLFQQKPANIQSTDIYLTRGAATAYAQYIEKSDLDGTLIQGPIPENDIQVSNDPSYTPEPSFSPWPRDAYANPEQFIIEYFNRLNANLYDQAWNMLSLHFQQACCNIGGNEPYTVYQAYWDSIQRVDVLSAYLQEWDSNPAVVNVSLKYTFINGQVSEGLFVFYLIADANRKTLLIYEVK